MLNYKHDNNNDKNAILIFQLLINPAISLHSDMFHIIFGNTAISLSCNILTEHFSVIIMLYTFNSPSLNIFCPLQLVKEFLP